MEGALIDISIKPVNTKGKHNLYTDNLQFLYLITAHVKMHAKAILMIAKKNNMLLCCTKLAAIFMYRSTIAS